MQQLNPSEISEIIKERINTLDVSVQAQILNMLEDLKAEYGLTLVVLH